MLQSTAIRISLPIKTEIGPTLPLIATSLGYKLFTHQMAELTIVILSIYGSNHVATGADLYHVRWAYIHRCMKWKWPWPWPLVALVSRWRFRRAYTRPCMTATVIRWPFCVAYHSGNEKIYTILRDTPRNEPDTCNGRSRGGGHVCRTDPRAVHVCVHVTSYNYDVYHAVACQQE